MERETPKPDIVDLSFAQGHEGLLRLAKALRLIDGGVWVTPAEFRWDFRIITDEPGCGAVGCALGLAVNMWPDTRFMCPGNFAARLYPTDIWNRSFDFAAIFAPRTADFEKVTPTMVADVIEDYIETRVVRSRELHPDVFDQHA